MNPTNSEPKNPFLKYEKGQTYWEERAILEFTEVVLDIMQKRRISKAELAKRLDTAPPFVSKLLSGDNNYTLKTMVKVARALKGKLRLTIDTSENEESKHDSGWEQMRLENEQFVFRHSKETLSIQAAGHRRNTSPKVECTFSEFVTFSVKQ